MRTIRVFVACYEGRDYAVTTALLAEQKQTYVEINSKGKEVRLPVATEEDVEKFFASTGGGEWYTIKLKDKLNGEADDLIEGLLWINDDRQGWVRRPHRFQAALYEVCVVESDFGSHTVADFFMLDYGVRSVVGPLIANEMYYTLANHPAYFRPAE